MEKFEVQITRLIKTHNFRISGATDQYGNIITLRWDDQSFSTTFTYAECNQFSPDFIHDIFVQRLYDHMVPPHLVPKSDKELTNIETIIDYNKDIDKQIKQLIESKI